MQGCILLLSNFYVSRTFTENFKLKCLIATVEDKSAPVPTANDLYFLHGPE
jgi:hypothetical protein